MIVLSVPDNPEHDNLNFNDSPLTKWHSRLSDQGYIDISMFTKDYTVLKLRHDDIFRTIDQTKV